MNPRGDGERDGYIPRNLLAKLGHQLPYSVISEPEKPHVTEQALQHWAYEEMTLTQSQPTHIYSLILVHVVVLQMYAHMQSMQASVCVKGFPYHDLFLFLDEFDVLVDVQHVLLEDRCGAKQALAGLQLLQSLIRVIRVLTLSEFEVLPWGEREGGREGEREREC